MILLMDPTGVWESIPAPLQWAVPPTAAAAAAAGGLMARSARRARTGCRVKAEAKSFRETIHNVRHQDPVGWGRVVESPEVTVENMEEGEDVRVVGRVVTVRRGFPGERLEWLSPLMIEAYLGHTFAANLKRRLDDKRANVLRLAGPRFMVAEYFPKLVSQLERIRIVQGREFQRWAKVHSQLGELQRGGLHRPFILEVGDLSLRNSSRMWGDDHQVREQFDMMFHHLTHPKYKAAVASGLRLVNLGALETSERTAEWIQERIEQGLDDGAKVYWIYDSRIGFDEGYLEVMRGCNFWGRCWRNTWRSDKDAYEREKVVHAFAPDPGVLVA